MDNGATSSFVPSWPKQPHIDGGCFLPNDDGTRTPYPKKPPQSVLDIVKATYGQTFTLKNAKDVKSARFHLFPKLPFELRKRVWWYSLPGARVIEFYCVEGKFWTEEEQPIALYVCQESRKTALEVYKLLNFEPERTTEITYFDYELDILYLGVGNISNCQFLLVEMLRRGIKRGDLELVQNVAIDNDLFSQLLWVEFKPYLHLQSSRDDCLHLGSLFPALHSLTSVVIPSATMPLIYQLRSWNDSVDIIIANDGDSGKEFRPWMVENNGDLLSLTIPLGRATWEVQISDAWRYIELHGPTDTTLRIVSLDRLEKDTKWRTRRDYLNSLIYFGGHMCLFEVTEELRRLLHLRENDQNLYRAVGHVLARSFYCEGSLERLTKIDPDAFVDPIVTYVRTRYCDCQSEHGNSWATPWSSCRTDRFFLTDEGFDIIEEMRKIHTLDIMSDTSLGEKRMSKWWSKRDVLIFPAGRDTSLTRRLSM
ncbi:hypothetical protein BELL_0325g00100 [Botrytis elliptica]|uniref:2EXR domain-containing protein n=1 Tax=Botrytis elliptica TaxID=278938 RepID=A0A4Z1JJX1_9HELO|nr:hypothetical protein EAE99_007526 [Botrytis elliptica]TGO73868.1 hypothetical protein BELL_0325g00100 [Botrytis elliptica]